MDYNELAHSASFLFEVLSMKSIYLSMMIMMLASCSIPIDEPPVPTAFIVDTPIPSFAPTPASSPPPSQTQLPALTLAPAPQDFCADIRGTKLIESLSSAFANKDGELLASLLSPAYGVDVLFYRDGNAINYDSEHIKILFETTFETDWGNHTASGEPTIGSFQEIVVPSLQEVFTPNSLIVCSQLQTGSTTYIPEWPYPGMDYYSVYFPGSGGNDNFDWQTWAVGMDRVGGKPFLAALVHYVWEP